MNSGLSENPSESEQNLFASLPAQDRAILGTGFGPKVHNHYFFMRKFWFMYLARALVAFPGGYGTMDELFEVLTLLQTRKVQRPVQVIVYGREYWDDVVDFDKLVEWGAISAADLELVHKVDDVEEAFALLTRTIQSSRGRKRA